MRVPSTHKQGENAHAEKQIVDHPELLGQIHHAQSGSVVGVDGMTDAYGAFYGGEHVGRIHAVVDGEREESD